MRNDEAYANAAQIPGGVAYADRWAVAGRQFRELQAALGRARLNHPYGPRERNRYDLDYPASRPAGLYHGGYWRAFGREDFAHLARGATLEGHLATIVVLASSRHTKSGRSPPPAPGDS